MDLTQPVNVTKLGWKLPKEAYAPRKPSPGRFQHDGENLEGVRKTPEFRLRESILQTLEAVLRGDAYMGLVDAAARIETQPRPGRPTSTTPSAITVACITTRLMGSQRAAHRELGDQLTWQRLRTYVKSRWPDRPDLWLPPHSPSRTAQMRAVARLRAHGFVAQAEAVVLADAFAAARQILEPSPAPYTDPAAGNVLVGDGTTIKANTYYEPGSLGVRHDGTTYPHRADPSARRMGKGKAHEERNLAPTDQSGRHPRGLDYTIVTARNRQGNERVVFDIQPRPAGKGDAEVFTDWVLAHQADLPMATVALYDMALRGQQASRLIEAGIIPMTKVPRDKGGQADTANLGIHTFNLTDKTTEHMPLITVDGHAGIVLPAAGDEWWIPLQRGQVRRRPTTIYATLTIPPDCPHVPARLSGATCLVRLNSTAKEAAAGISRADHLRAFPEQDAVFQDLYGLREDIESTNAKFKASLWGRRARTADPELNRLDSLMWGLIENTRARLAHHERLTREGAQPPIARAG